MSTQRKRKVVPTEAGDQTKKKILSAAERLFAESGYEGVSLRSIGTTAEVPFALVTYHFGTKLGLYQAIFRHRRDLFATERMKILQKIRITGDVESDIRQIATAIVKPLIGLRDLEGGMDLTRLIAREIFDPVKSDNGMVEEYLDPIAHVAIDLLQKVVPKASYKKICWAFYFATGALVINHARTGRLERLSSGQCQTSDTIELTEELTTFVTAGLTAALCQE